MTTPEQSEGEVDRRDVVVELGRIGVSVLTTVLKALVFLGIAAAILYLMMSAMAIASSHIPPLSSMSELFISSVPGWLWTAVVWVWRGIGVIVWIFILAGLWGYAKERAEERVQNE